MAIKYLDSKTGLERLNFIRDRKIWFFERNKKIKKEIQFIITHYLKFYHKGVQVVHNDRDIIAYEEFIEFLEGMAHGSVNPLKRKCAKLILLSLQL